MSKHTPGPWRGNELNKGEALIVEPCDTSLPPICLVDRQPNAWDNANLIAAAPEMYEALKIAKANLQFLPPTHVVEQIDAALAKAEGRPA